MGRQASDGKRRANNMMPRIACHDGCWWEEIARRKTKRVANRIYKYFVNAPLPLDVAMSRLFYPDSGETQYIVWLELMDIELVRGRVTQFMN